MADSYTPFSLSQVVPVANPDGTVGWKFVGGVEIDALEGSGLLVGQPSKRIAFVRDPPAVDSFGYPPGAIGTAEDNTNDATMGVIASAVTPQTKAILELIAQANDAHPGGGVELFLRTNDGQPSRISAALDTLGEVIILENVGGVYQSGIFPLVSQILANVLTGGWPQDWIVNYPIARNVWILYGGSGYSVNAALSSLDLWVNGNAATTLPFFFNQTSVHEFMGIGAVGTALVKGNNTLEIRSGSPGGNVLQSDGNDHAFILILPRT